MPSSHLDSVGHHSLAILDDYQSASTAYTDWSSLIERGLKITTFHEAISPKDVVEKLKGFTIVHAMRERTKFPREVLEKLPNLRFITTTGMKNRGIDLEAARSLGITVSGATSNSNLSPGTVEQTWTLILALTRRLIPEYQVLQSGGWQSGVATTLHGKTLGLIGVGRIGTAVAVVGKAFGMKVIAWSPHLDVERAKAAGVEFVASLDTILETSDVVSMHMVLSETTKGMIGERELERMKRSAVLVNTSRGPLIDETALINAVKERRIAGVGLDVFHIEPLPEDHIFRSMQNVVLSPHMGYVDDESYKDWWPQTVENIHAFLDSEPIRVLN